MSRYLVTGAAGFIAARVAEMLLEEGHEVVGIDDLNHAYDIRLKQWRLDRLLANRRFSFLKADIADKSILDEVTQLAKGSSAVINLAARAGVRSSVTNPWIYYDTNVNGVINMLEICRRLDISKFVQASSSSVYGENSPMPFREDANTDYPMQPYAASKKASEVLAYTYHYLHQLDVTVFRYFTVYGPAARPDMAMFRFTQWIAEGKPVRVNGDGEQSRGFTYVDDIARGTIAGLRPVGYEIFNLGGHEVITMNDLIHLFEEVLGKEARVEYLSRHMADSLGNLASVEKAKEQLGWEPLVNLTDGVSRLVDWYRRERSWASQVVTG
jgi:nucleoside-diphosphate-sugar epimerase